MRRSWSSSVSIVSDYGLDDRDSIPERGKILLLILSVNTTNKNNLRFYYNMFRFYKIIIRYSFVIH
jgi:hypothetical protein